MTAFRFRQSEWLLVVVGLVALAGCGRGPKIPTASVTGTVTINGKPVEHVAVRFVPKEMIRPALGMTDASGRYAARFLIDQDGVPLGPCVVQITYSPSGGSNVLPSKYSDKAGENPGLQLVVPQEGTTFDYDVKTDNPLP